MFSRNKRLVSYLASLIVAFGVVTVPSAAQAQEVPVPATTIVDRCGTVHDEIFVPISDAAAYYRDVVNYDYPLVENSYHSSGGAAYVKIIAEYTAYDSNGVGYLKQEVFEHTFDTSAPNGCAQAQDTGSVAVGACDQNTGRTLITPSITNTPDASGFPLDWVELHAYGSGGTFISVPITRGKVLDGQTVSWTGGLDADYPVYPGHYVGDFMTMKPHRVIVKGVKFTVHSCGDYLLVEDGDDSGGGSSARPVARLKLVKCATGRVKATMDNRQMATPWRFKLTQKSAQGKVTSRIYKVKPRKVKTVYRSGTNSTYKLYVQNAHNKKWSKKPAKLRTPVRSRCKQ